MTTTPLRCHYCDGEDRPPVLGWLVELRGGHPTNGSTWERPVCARHAVLCRRPTYVGDLVVLRPLDGEPVRFDEPCGAHAVIERDHGSPSLTRWCERTKGPCPFPGADVLDGDGRRSCAAAVTERYADALDALVDDLARGAAVPS